MGGWRNGNGKWPHVLFVCFYIFFMFVCFDVCLLSLRLFVIITFRSPTLNSSLRLASPSIGA